VLVSFVYLVACRLFALVLLLARSDRSKELELLVLRHELSILRRQARRPQLRESDRLVLAALSRVMPRRSWQAFLVTPETLLRWHRRIIARRWRYPHRRPGRPAVDQEVRQLILRLARENSHWGYVRIVGELRKLGITVSATLVRNVLARAGIPPAPERVASSWRSFLRQHGDTILACDLFTVDTVWLRRLYVLFFVSIGTRRVEYVACTSKPDTAWMTQQARNLLMDLDDRSRRPRFLIHDRDTKFSRAFDAIFRSEGIEIVRTPIQAPNANAYAERWVGSVRRECLDRLLIFGRRQLEHVLRVYIRHFNQQRPHRALDLQPPDRGSGTDPSSTATLYTPQVRRRDLLGGLLHEYEAAA
jgi:putative transposase